MVAGLENAPTTIEDLTRISPPVHDQRLAMLASFSRHLVRGPHGANRILIRSLAGAAESTDIKRFQPQEWFASFEDPIVRAELNKIREVENDLLQTVSAKTVPIDWSYWAEEIKYPGIVDELKEMHESTPVPDIESEQAKAEEQIESIFNPIIEEFSKLASEAEAETKELEKRAEEVAYLRENIKELSVDEFLEKYPTVKKSIEDDLANNRWFVRDS